MVAADDEVRAAVVLPRESVQDGFHRASVAHRHRERRQQRAILRIVVFEEGLVAKHPHGSRDVVGLCAADERMDHQAVDLFERDLCDVLVRAVDRVARLEAHDAGPPPLREEGPGLPRIALVRGERRA